MSHQSEVILENNLIQQLVGLGYGNVKLRKIFARVYYITPCFAHVYFS